MQDRYKTHCLRIDLLPQAALSFWLFDMVAEGPRVYARWIVARDTRRMRAVSTCYLPAALARATPGQQRNPERQRNTDDGEGADVVRSLRKRRKSVRRSRRTIPCVSTRCISSAKPGSPCKIVNELLVLRKFSVEVRATEARRVFLRAGAQLWHGVKHAGSAFARTRCSP